MTTKTLNNDKENPQTLASEIKELEEGCGKRIKSINVGCITWCGNIIDNFLCLCPECQEKLSQAIKDKERIDRIFEKLKEEFGNWECLDGWYNEHEKRIILDKFDKIKKEECE